MKKRATGEPDDVRMRGFARRTTVEATLAWLDAHARPLASEICALEEAAGRVLSADVISPRDVPGFDRSMMDGFAVQARDVEGSSPYNRLPLEIVGESLPGRPFAGEITAGQAARIMTGAPLPRGADAVLPAELAEAEGSRVWAQGDVSPGKHVGRRGEDVAAGAVMLQAGRRLRPQDVGLLSSAGFAEASVITRPQVQIILTGTELLPPGRAPSDFLIADANGPMLSALVERDGGDLLPRKMVADDLPAITAAIAAPADITIVSGGSSVGQEDHVPMVLAELGELAVHGIAMRPSSPCGMGRIGEKLVFLLPGNPVSCLCAYDFFAGRAIRILGGRERQWPYRAVRAPLLRKISSVIGRVDYARVKLISGNVEPLSIGGASTLSSTTRADGFVVIDADSEGFGPGSEVTVYLYDLP